MSCRSTAGAAPSVQSAPCSPATSASNVSLSASDTYIYRFDDQARYFDTLLELGASYSELSRTAESFLRFIDERVVWTRNAAPLWWSDAAPAAEALAWLFGPAQWASLPRTVADDAARTPWPYAALLGVVLAVVLPWRRTRTALTACGRRAAAATTTRYLPTVQGLLLTLALAAPGPAVAWLLARRLAATDDPGFAQALASGLAVAALVYFPLEIRTLTTAATLSGIWLVWSDMVPALSVLDRVALWPFGAAPGTEGALTLEHLGLTLIVAVLTTALARNVPALLEMLLLRLPINPGSRYALTTISRYVLVFTGSPSSSSGCSASPGRASSGWSPPSGSGSVSACRRSSPTSSPACFCSRSGRCESATPSRSGA